MSVAANSESSRSLGPLVVRPATAAQMLSASRQHVYNLIDAKEIESFKDGGARKITVASIEAYVRRQIAAGAERPRAA